MIGFDQECWVAEQIIGEEFLFVLALEILKVKTEMDWVKIGLLAMKTSNPIMIR